MKFGFLLLSYVLYCHILLPDLYGIRNNNFTYQEILADRITQPLPCDYLNTKAERSDSAISIYLKDRTKSSGLLRFVLFQEDSFSRNTYNYCCQNLKGDIVFMNFGKYANVSVNLKNAVMYNEFLQICIPYGNWKNTTVIEQVKN